MNSSSVDFSLNKLVEFFPTYSLSSIATNWMDDFHQLLLSIAVFQLFVDVSQIVNVKLAFSLHVQ